jgi:hypothetical protein
MLPPSMLEGTNETETMDDMEAVNDTDMNDTE